jgi:hypothetical protein
MRLIDSNRVTYGIRLSDRIWQDTNGQLICRDAIIARTGSYDYLESEIKENGDKNKIVKVFRTDDEVFNPISMASFENKPFVDDHPQEDVSPENFHELSKGYIRDIRRGTGELSNCLICDIVVTDSDTAEEIKSGRKRELSLGYDTNIIMKDGKYIMTNIRGNHLALVDSGRAGCATIRDSAAMINRGGNKMRKSKVTLFDDDIYEVEEIKEEDDALDVEEDETVDEVQDDEPTLAQIYQVLMEIKAKLDTPVADAEPEVEEKKEEIIEEQQDCKDDDEELEEKEEFEEVEDDDEEVEEIKEDELLDADEELEEELEVKPLDRKSVYSKFAKARDSKATSATADVQKSWQDRYNKLAQKSY